VLSHTLRAKFNWSLVQDLCYQNLAKTVVKHDLTALISWERNILPIWYNWYKGNKLTERQTRYMSDSSECLSFNDSNVMRTKFNLLCLFFQHRIVVYRLLLADGRSLGGLTPLYRPTYLPRGKQWCNIDRIISSTPSPYLCKIAQTNYFYYCNY